MGGKRKKIFWSLAETYIAFWPMVIGLFLLKPDGILNGLTVFLSMFNFADHEVHNYTVNTGATFFWIAFLLWPILFKIEKIHSKKESTKDFQQVISTSPDLKAAPKARIAFDGVYKLFLDSDWVDADLEDATFNKAPTINAKLFSTLEVIKALAEAYFPNTSNRLNTNFMVFIKKGSVSNEILKLIMAESDLVYLREQKEEFLLGILVLFPEFKSQKTHRIKPIVFPVYSLEGRAYNCEAKKFDDDIHLPGAHSAQFFDYSVIHNTKDKESYVNLDDATKKEIISFFEKSQNQVKSVCSFKIPYMDEECLGILNIDCSRTNRFGNDDEYMELFYTLIYGILKTASPFLTYFLKFKIAEYEKKLAK